MNFFPICLPGVPTVVTQKVKKLAPKFFALEKSKIWETVKISKWKPHLGNIFCLLTFFKFSLLGVPLAFICRILNFEKSKTKKVKILGNGENLEMETPRGEHFSPFDFFQILTPWATSSIDLQN